MKPIVIDTVDALIDRFGGLTETGKFFGVSPQVVWRWKKRGKLPARSFLTQRRQLDERGVAASVALWGMQTARHGAEQEGAAA